ncbi:MAG: hypothetical protein FJ244_09400 [Nitrospira sp.]|nr:hypothetical protein [Nitrospira sp.]
MINQREFDIHILLFVNALEPALQEDLDIILVGEMRDLETIQLVLTAAKTGHLVFGTLHISSAPRQSTASSMRFRRCRRHKPKFSDRKPGKLSLHKHC